MKWNIPEKMPNVFEYLAEDNAGKMTEPTEADLYLFTILSYTRIERFCHLKGEITVAEYAKKCYDPDEKTYGMIKNAERFLQQFGKKERYASLKLFAFKSIFDSISEVQYASLAIKLPGDAVFISFRGTDGSLLGWKEDFNLTYYTEIPAESAALEYLDAIMEEYPHSRFYLGGHSKGGILAMYAASKIGREKQERIEYVMDCDCPGFNKSLLEDAGYNAILDRIHSFIPKYSLVGLLFGKKQEITVIASSGLFYYQHSPWTWCLSDGSLCHLETIASGEELTANKLNRIMELLSEEEMKFFVDTVYRLINDDKKDLRIKDLASVKRLKNAYSRYKNLSSDDRKNLQTVVKTIFLCFVSGRKQ